MTITQQPEVAAAPGITRQRPIPDLKDVNAFTADRVASAIAEQRAPCAWERAVTLGARARNPQMLKTARDAQRYTPELRTLDRLGNEVYDVDFRPQHDLPETSAALAPVCGSSVARAHLLRAAAAVLEVIADDTPGEPAWPGEPLTHSETRVLRYLPTHMSAPEIVAHLSFISAFTELFMPYAGLHRRLV